MTWTLVKGHKGPVKGLRASGPHGLDPLFTDTHYSNPLTMFWFPCLCLNNFKITFSLIYND
jgi:hypothetical protein